MIIKKLFAFGDIHGCYEPLKEYFDNNPFSEDTFYVFVGDYIDRGIQNAEVIEFLHSIKDFENVIMLLGNHECHIKKLMMNNNDMSCISYAQETIKTLKSLTVEQNKQLREIVRKCHIYYNFEFDNKKYQVTHGGLPCLVDNFKHSSNDVIKGIGEYSEALKVDKNFEQWSLENQNKWKTQTRVSTVTHMNNDGTYTKEDLDKTREEQPEMFYSIHGHRNIKAENPIASTTRTFNLCDDVEHGGNLRILEITKDK